MAAEVIAAWIAAGASLLASAFSWGSQRAADRAADRTDQATTIIAAKTDVHNTDKSIYVERVTAERGIWRSDMRRETATVIAWLYAPVDEMGALHAALAGIALRLNPKGRSADPAERDSEPLDRDIYAAVAAIRACLGNGGRYIAAADRLEGAVGLLLKAEWEVSKGESKRTALA